MNSSTVEIKYSQTFQSAIKSKINLFAELAKVRITLFVALSTSAGYILQKGMMWYCLFKLSEPAIRCALIPLSD